MQTGWRVGGGHRLGAVNGNSGRINRGYALSCCMGHDGAIHEMV